MIALVLKACPQEEGQHVSKQWATKASFDVWQQWLSASAPRICECFLLALKNARALESVECIIRWKPSAKDLERGATKLRFQPYPLKMKVTHGNGQLRPDVPRRSLQKQKVWNYPLMFRVSCSIGCVSSATPESGICWHFFFRPVSYDR